MLLDYPEYMLVARYTYQETSVPFSDFLFFTVALYMSLLKSVIYDLNCSVSVDEAKISFLFVACCSTD